MYSKTLKVQPSYLKFCIRASISNMVNCINSPRYLVLLPISFITSSFVFADNNTYFSHKLQHFDMMTTWWQPSHQTDGRQGTVSVPIACCGSPPLPHAGATQSVPPPDPKNNIMKCKQTRARILLRGKLFDRTRKPWQDERWFPSFYFIGGAGMYGREWWVAWWYIWSIYLYIVSTECNKLGK